MSDSCAPWTVAHKTSLFMGFPRQEYWSGLPFPSPGDLSHPEIEPESLALQADSLPTEPPGKPYISIDLNICIYVYINIGFPSDSVGKETTCNAGDSGSISGCERSPGEGNGNPLKYSCLENPMDRGAWQATVHGVSKSQT